jgi:beta-lactamase superfamily II metal-dependent hydrolase
MSVVASAPQAGVVTCVFWDVQHGHATYIGTPDGEHLIIDAGVGSVGTGGQAFSPIQWLWNRWGVRQLDAAIITHPHRDHVADIANLERLNPRILQRPKLQRQSVLAANAQQVGTVETYEDWEIRYNAPVTSASPIACNRANGYSAQTFVPTRCPETNLNNRSIVTVISYAGIKLLIPGDNESPSWLELLERESFVRAIQGTDVLLAAHHGREAGFCEELFAVIQPRLTVISDGPSGATSVTASYARHTTGWQCHRRGRSEMTERHVLSTRRDGAVAVRFGWNGDTPFLEVRIN